MRSLKKKIAVFLVCLSTCIVSSGISIFAQENKIEKNNTNTGTDCPTCEFSTDEELNKVIEESRNYTKEEFNKIITNIKNSNFYQQEANLIDHEYPTDVKKFKEESGTVYTQTFMLHSNYEEFTTDSMVFVLDEDFNIVACVTTKFNGETITIEDKVTGENELLANEKQARIDCQTWMCTDLEKKPGYVDDSCKKSLGLVCSAIKKKITKWQSALCKTGALVSCYHPPYTICWQGRWAPVCPY